MTLETYRFTPSTEAELKDFLETIGHPNSCMFNEYLPAVIGVVKSTGQIVYDSDTVWNMESEEWIDEHKDEYDNPDDMDDDMCDDITSYIDSELSWMGDDDSKPLFADGSDDDGWYGGMLTNVYDPEIDDCVNTDDLEFEMVQAPEMKDGRGYVYIVQNECFKDNMLKIGRTGATLDQRIDGLSSSTSVPTDFTLYAAVKTKAFKEVETKMHRELNEFRVSRNKEFFRCSPEKALKTLKGICEVLDDAEFIMPGEYEQGKRRRKEAFTFSNRGIGVGTVLEIVSSYCDVKPVENTVKVVSDWDVEYCGKVMTPNELIKSLRPDHNRLCVDDGLMRGGRKLRDLLHETRAAKAAAGTALF